MTDPTVEKSATKTVAVPLESLFSDDERSAPVGFLAGYAGQTRDAYTVDLRQYTSWCATHGLRLFAAKRGHRVLRPRPRTTWPGAGHDRPQVVHSRRVLPLRR